MTFELMSELDMKAIWKRKGELHFRHILFHAHMWVGMAMAVVIALFWLQIYYNEQVRAHLFPYRGTYLQNICVDITGMIKGCFPESGLRGGLPGLIQGVGLLAVTGMAFTGVTMFFLIPSFGASAPIHIYQIPKKIHDYISEFVWVFWWVHISAGLLHFFRSPRFPAIFKL
jgi:hypothetical protein